jgi:hypothetical protein
MSTKILDIEKISYVPELTVEEVDGTISHSRLPKPEVKPTVTAVKSPEKS